MEMRPGASPPDRIRTCVPDLPCHRGRGAMTAFLSQPPPRRVPPSKSQVAESSSRDADSATLRLAGSLSLCSEEQKGEEAATPGQPVALGA